MVEVPTRNEFDALQSRHDASISTLSALVSNLNSRMAVLETKPPVVPPEPPEPISSVPMVFWIDEQLQTATTGSALEQIISHLNYVYAKTTNLELRLDDFTAVSSGFSLDLTDPTVCIDVRVKYAERHDGGVSSNVIVANTPNISGDNYHLCSTIAHEFGHIVRLGEFYSAWTMRDLTNVLPIADIKDGNGAYWDSRQLAKRDPGIGFSWDVMSIETWREYCQLCPFSSHMVNEYVRLGEAFFTDEQFAVPVNPVTVRIQTEPSAYIRMFGLENDSVAKTQAMPMRGKFADLNGEALFEWGGGEFIATQGNHARLFHASKGNHYGKAWITVHDLHAGKVMPGGGADGDFHYPGYVPIELS
jgi:hypothetical protein